MAFRNYKCALYALQYVTMFSHTTILFQTPDYELCLLKKIKVRPDISENFQDNFLYTEIVLIVDKLC